MIFLRTNTRLRADIAEQARALKAAQKRIEDLLIEQFQQRDVIDLLKAAYNDTDALLKDARGSLRDARSCIVAKDTEVRDLEAKLARFTNRTRDPVTKRFVKRAAA